jgi:HEAT repeat protein
MTARLRRALLAATLACGAAALQAQEPAPAANWAALRAALDSREVEQRMQAVRQASATGDPQATDLLIEALRNPSRNVRDAAAEALTDHLRPPAMAPLLAAVADSNTVVRRVSVRALAILDDPRATEALVDRMLNDADGNVRAPAAEALRGRSAPGLVDALCRAMLDRDDSVRIAALGSLHERQDPASVDAALLAVGDVHPTVRAGARELAIVLAGPATATNFVRALSTPNLQVTRFAAEALGRLKEPTATWPLVELLKTATDGNVRGAAAQALGEIGDARAVPALIDLLDSQDLALRETGRQALVRLTGTDYGTSPARWKARSTAGGAGARLHASTAGMIVLKSVLAWVGVAVARRAGRFWAGAAFYGTALLALNVLLQVAAPAWYEQPVYGALLSLAYYGTLNRFDGEPLWIAIAILGGPTVAACF